MRALLVLVLLSSVASADATLTITSTPNGGAYAPRNIVVAWIERADGSFVRTIYRRANARKQHLVAWTQKAGPDDVDAISGGTIDVHITHTIRWNLRDRTGQVLPDGDYVMRVESTEGNSTNPGQNNQGMVPFTKSDQSITINNISTGGFINGTFVFNNTTGGCENGLLEAGESCDNTGGAGSCPTSCPPSTIMCFSNNLVGSPQLCNASCVNQPIMECISDDGCCPTGCDGDTDSDCPGGGGGGEPDELSNCNTGGGSSAGWLLAGLVLGVLVLRPRR
jgi:MYXO-CTERM domain-containing protein